VPFDLELTEVVFLGANSQHPTTSLFRELKQLPSEPDVIALDAILWLRASAASSEKVLIGLRPNGGAVAQNLGRALFQPRGQFRFVLAVRFIGLGEGADRQVVSSKRPKVPIFITLGVPDQARTPDPLA